MGAYPGVIEKIELESGGKYGDQFAWYFVVDHKETEDEPFGNLRQKAWSPTYGTPKNKFTRWSSAALGRDIEAGEEIDTEDLVGKRVMIELTVDEKDGETRNNVHDVKPIKKPKTPINQDPPKVEGEEDSPFDEENLDKLKTERENLSADLIAQWKSRGFEGYGAIRADITAWYQRVKKSCPEMKGDTIGANVAWWLSNAAIGDLRAYSVANTVQEAFKDE